MHLRHFAYTKMQFGISATPLIFQEAIDSVLRDIPYICAYQDDILISAPTKNIHDNTLRKVKERLTDNNFRLNMRKCQIGLLKVNFLGFLLANGKLLPNPEHLLALMQMPLPSNKDQLHSFLGSLRHCGCFCPNFSSITRPLYLLLKRDVHWKWLPLHLKAVHDFLAAISKGSLTCYDILKPLFATSDASKDSLSFVLSHDADQREIVWTGSRVLMSAEANYSNIEREVLTIVEAVKYFHRFLAGRHFIIRSDHAPLKFIFNSKNNAG